MALLSIPPLHLCIVVALSLPVNALALVGGAGVAPNTADSPWAGVGSLSVGGQKFTATLIAPGYVLTAAHVAQGADPSTVMFQVNAGNSFAIAASEIFVNPDYTGSNVGNVAGDPTNHADLAIIKLSSPVSGDVPFYNLFEGSLQNKYLNFVSFAGSTTSKTIGENRVDLQFADASGVKQVYMFDFDGPDLTSNRLGANSAANGTLGATREASLVGGDSGSAAFVNVNGQWQLAGINTFEVSFAQGPSSSGEFGTGGGGIVLSSYVPWIQGVVLAPVPEPESWLMFLFGIPLMIGVSRSIGLDANATVNRSASMRNRPRSKLNRPGFLGGQLVKVKPGFLSARRVADSSFPQPRPVEYTQ